jgi:hypothetical protein
MLSTPASINEVLERLERTFRVGVEVMGPDMRWRLEMATRVIKNTPDDWDWNDPDTEGAEPEWTYFYNAGQARMLDADSIRSPEEGLKRIFGNRPWIW